MVNRRIASSRVWTTDLYDDYFIGLKNKLMGQANLVCIGKPFVTNHGSFTLTSGVLSQEPMKAAAPSASWLMPD